MSGYSYDRYVPIIFAGKPFKAGLYAGGHVVDIAPTLAFLLGIIPPSSSEGSILEKSLLLK
jgi:predicted AlkP superfamily pyrophosphatase or phosphodiesterase